MTALTKEQINKAFENENHQANVMINLYKIAIPEWDNIRKLNGWPSISNTTWTYICDKFIAFDRKNHPDVLSGGCWMNSGFSIEKMEDWKILPIDSNKIVYKNTCNKVTLITVDNMRKYDGMIAIRFHRLLENNHSYYHPTKSSYRRLSRLLTSDFVQHTPKPTFKGRWTVVG